MGLQRKGLEGISIEEATGEPRQGCLSSPGSQREGGLGMGSEDQPGASCRLPIGLTGQETSAYEERSWGWGEEEESKGNGVGCSLEGECVHAGSLVLRLLFLSYRREPYGKSQGRVQQTICISSPGMPFQGHGFH